MSSVEILQAPRPDVNSTSAEDGAATSWEESYKPLPVIFLVLFGIWAALLALWCVNTWTKRRYQLSNLQWALTSVPLLKTLVLGMSLVFWYSCLSLDTCSFWVAFGVFVSRIFFETSCFVAFLLLAHGYCITHEQLTLTERRKIAVLAGLLYLTLTGYKAALPQFSVLVAVIYLLLLFVIFHQTGVNLAHLRAQQQGILEDGLQGMYCAVHSKYRMFRRFQGAMAFTLVVEVLMHAGGEGMADEYWIRLLVREVLELGIFAFIGWTFRSRQQSPFFAVIPTVQEEEGPRKLPPIHSVEMDENEFRSADFRDWHIGVPASAAYGAPYGPAMIVIVQNPCELMMADQPIPSRHLSTPPPAPQASKAPDPMHQRRVPTGFGKAIEERLRATFRCGALNPSVSQRVGTSRQAFGSAFEKAEPKLVTGAAGNGKELGLSQDCSHCGKPVDRPLVEKKLVVGSKIGGFGEDVQTAAMGGLECPDKRRHAWGSHT
ncbi:hypothetical protein KFL_005660050 [Klebsormidium nitens]|uniref:Uncharacterized protein n=1 Tax=Klebsormidium nitens TaxID=105231 RepID=A0A1Y1IL25_KLENI|nr:hypothetical protein KFL_005660050 [Klebsormidium nitens]|eukprot:GAQ89821.1 hypothetical protein KFL_005660050 [Klebsormidium nitens]